MTSTVLIKITAVQSMHVICVTQTQWVANTLLVQIAFVKAAYQTDIISSAVLNKRCKAGICRS